MNNNDKHKQNLKIKKILDFSYWISILIIIFLIVITKNNILGISMFFILMIIMLILHKIFKIPFRKN